MGACKGDPDTDDDGVVASLDCDDADASRYPGGVERCDGIDQDCDEAVDETAIDALEWFLDADTDNFGALSAPVLACEAPQGHVGNAGDCDDADSAVNPDASEACGGGDEDCDGATDEAGALGEEYGWIDGDGDGQGAADSLVESCVLPGNAVQNADDCDDANAAIYGGAPETWYDGVDGDCANDDDFDADADGYPGGANGTDCYDDVAEANPAAAEICNNGLDDDCDGTPGPCGIFGNFGAGDRADVTIEAESLYGVNAGTILGAAGDIDGGGTMDVFVGDSHAGTGGAVYLVHGPYSSSTSLSNSFARIVGADMYAYLGTSAVGAGDLNGDGWADLALHSFSYEGVENQSAIWIVHGPVSGEHSVVDVGVAIVAAYNQDDAGYGLDAGSDVNGDGVPDLLIGAQRADFNGENAGAAYVVTEEPQTTISLSTAAGTLFGEAAGDWAGRTVSLLDDADGDGLAEVVVGARGSDRGGVDAGAAYVVCSPTSGVLDLGGADVILVGEAAGDLAGWTVADGGDTDGDGYSELLVGAPGNDHGENAAGAVYVLNPMVATNLAQGTARLQGTGYYDTVGLSIAGGDVNGDGLSDIVVGSLTAPAAVGPGQVWLVNAPVVGVVDLDSGATAVFTADDAGDRLGEAIAVPGDVDGDGFGDLLLGAPHAQNSNGNNLGEVFLYFGGGI